MCCYFLNTTSGCPLLGDSKATLQCSVLFLFFKKESGHFWTIRVSPELLFLFPQCIFEILCGFDFFFDLCKNLKKSEMKPTPQKKNRNYFFKKNVNHGPILTYTPCFFSTRFTTFRGKPSAKGRSGTRQKESLSTAQRIRLFWGKLN